MPKKLKVGELIYLKNVGFPYDGNGTGGYDSMEGSSAIVKNLNAGANHRMVEVEFLLPIKSKERGHPPFVTCLFHPESCIVENRPWLRKYLKALIESKQTLIRLAKHIQDELNA